MTANNGKRSWWKVAGIVLLWIAGILIGLFLLLINWPLNSQTVWVILGAVMIAGASHAIDQHKRLLDVRHRELVARLYEIEHQLHRLDRAVTSLDSPERRY